MAVPRLWTVGHSTHSLDTLADALKQVSVTTLVDVRTIPRSRHNPQFDTAALAASLPARGVAYASDLHSQLGGLRKPLAAAGDANAGWRNASFRGYADYARTDEFGSALDELLRRAHSSNTAIMCAEAVPWRCHRSIIADVATARGASVRHIMVSAKGVATEHEHKMTPFAVLRDGGRVEYPAEAAAKAEQQKAATKQQKRKRAPCRKKDTPHASDGKSKRRRSASPAAVASIERYFPRMLTRAQARRLEES